MIVRHPTQTRNKKQNIDERTIDQENKEMPPGKMKITGQRSLEEH